MTLLEISPKKQHTVETLTQPEFEQIRVIASQILFVRNPGFSTDFLFIEPNTCLHIDIEVDEPFAFSTGEPIHCVGDDDYRNKCFTEANFIVMRFAEEQVRTQPLRCLRFLTKVINRYTSNDTWIHLFSEVERITQIKQWTNSGARKLKKQDYRQRYLNS